MNSVKNINVSKNRVCNIVRYQLPSLGLRKYHSKFETEKRENITFLHYKLFNTNFNFDKLQILLKMMTDDDDLRMMIQLQ